MLSAVTHGGAMCRGRRAGSERGRQEEGKCLSWEIEAGRGMRHPVT